MPLARVLQTQVHRTIVLVIHVKQQLGAFVCDLGLAEPEGLEQLPTVF